MRRLLAWLAALATSIFLIAAAPALLALLAILLLCADFGALFRSKRAPSAGNPSKDAASVVIPTWNGREHLARTLPSVVAALAGNQRNEVLVIDNASNDGTAEFLADAFPSVRVVELGTNLGFGRACNAGFSLARHDIVVLLNNDMRVEPDFLQPLVDGFQDTRVFSVTSQIHFEDATKAREETGLTAGRWHRGRIRIRHVVDEQVDRLFPTFYSGGGSTAFDRSKVLELGGFDEIFAPFYVEDVDLSYMAWKRGWVNLYAPRSIVHHEHRGTIGRFFSRRDIDRVVRKNRLLFLWKNMHHWGRLLSHFGWLYIEMWAALLAGPTADRPGARAFLAALRQAPRAAVRRVAARRVAEIPDAEALRRHLGGFFHDRYARSDEKPPSELQVLFVSPYPIEPPLHGGAVFMKQAVESLARTCGLHLLCLVDPEEDLGRQQTWASACASSEFVPFDPRLRRGAPLSWPHAAQSYWDPELHWKIHRAVFLKRIDVIQLEYAQLASYGERFRHLACCIFEHDLHFQAVRRGAWSGSWWRLPFRAYEYLRALRFEMRQLKAFDSVQVCSRDQGRLLRGMLGDQPPVLDDLRTAIDVASYPVRLDGREPDTILFVGNFRHPPNVEALMFCLEHVLPRIRKARPSARFIVAGAEAPPALQAVIEQHGAEHHGPFEEIREVLSRFAVFVAPILSGSGVRVKILEAFASGIPVVSTKLGAEGLCADGDGIAEIADRPADFAEAVLRLLGNESAARAMARRARAAAERKWNGADRGPLLAAHYSATLKTKQLSRTPYPLPLELRG